MTLYISPQGQDTNPGTAERPFATLKQARDAAREARQGGETGEIHIELDEGYYRIEDTVVFDLRDSALSSDHSDGKTIIQGRTGAVIGSGAPVGPWRRVPAESTPAEAPASARGKLWQADFPIGVERILSLFDGKHRLRRARGKSFKIDVDQSEVEKIHSRDLRFPRGALKQYSNLDSVELVIIPMHPWTMNILGIKSVDSAACVARLDNDPVYPLARTHHGIADQVWPENVFEALDSPGTWVSDSSRRTVYLWPKDDGPSDQIVAPMLRELIRIEGAIDPEAQEDQPVCGIEFHNLTFTHGERDTWDPDYQGTGLQHNWEFFDRGNAMVRFRGAERCALVKCRLVNSASGGVRLDLHCRENRVESCEISNIGGTGVLLQGYGPGTKDVNTHNRIVDNHIHHNGEDWWHNLGVFVWQSSHNLVAHNTIHHTGYTGICVTGRIIFDRSGKREASKSVRWNEITVATETGGTPESVTEWWYRMEPYLHSRGNVIEKNEIYRVMEKLGDGNAIYVSGCGRDNVVRGNFIHDIFGPGSNAMIRTDDLQYETLIEQNLVYRCGGPGVYLKHRNDFINNVLVDLGVEDPEAIYEGKPKFTGYVGFRRAPVTGSKVQRNILYSTIGDTEILSEGPSSRASWGASYLRECEADSNLYFSPQNPNWATEFLKEKRDEGVEQNSLQANPRFDDPGEQCLVLAHDSPAFDLGIKSFSLADAGSSLAKP